MEDWEVAWHKSARNKRKNKLKNYFKKIMIVEKAKQLFIMIYFQHQQQSSPRKIGSSLSAKVISDENCGK